MAMAKVHAQGAAGDGVENLFEDEHVARLERRRPAGCRTRHRQLGCRRTGRQQVIGARVGEMKIDRIVFDHEVEVVQRFEDGRAFTYGRSKLALLRA